MKALSSFSSWCSGVYRDARLKINVEEHHQTDTLVRQLGLFSVILFTITQAVGAGILTTPGIISRDYAGSHAFLSFLWAGLICAPPALCLAKMSRFTSKSGSTGSYACLVLGQFVGLLMFVDVMLECMGGTAAVAVSQADHIKIFLRVAFGWHLPDAVTETPEAVAWLPLFGAIFAGTFGWLLAKSGWRSLVAGDKACLPSWLRSVRQTILPFGIGRFVTPRNLSLTTFGTGLALLLTAAVCTFIFLTRLPSVNLLSITVDGGITAVLLRGIKETKNMTNAFTILKIVVVSVIVYLLAQHYNPANLAIPLTAHQNGPLAGAAVAFFAFVGLDLATMTAAETKNAKRNVPLGMIIGLIAVTVLYVATAYFYNAAVPFDAIKTGKEEAAPLAQALELLGYKSALIWVTLGSTLALISVLLASAYSTTRLIYNMAQHGLLPAQFERVSEKRQVPVLATLTVGGLVALLTGLLAVGELMHLTNIGTMTAFITISLTVLVKTVRETDWRSLVVTPIWSLVVAPIWNLLPLAISGKSAHEKTEWRAAAVVLVKNLPRLGMTLFWIVVAILGVLGPARLLKELPPEAFYRLIFVWGTVTLLFIFYSRHHSLARKQAQPSA